MSNDYSARLRLEMENTRRELGRRVQQLEDLYRAGIALSSQENLPSLYHLILQTGRGLTQADAATIYLVEEEGGQQILVFSAAQTASLATSYERQTVPLTAHSIAGSVALSGQLLRIDDVYAISAGAPYSFNPSFDHASGYRTRSMLTAPMLNLAGGVVGVLQLINRKRDPAAILVDERAVDQQVVPFTAEDERIVLALASQAAVAVENRRLLETDRLYRELQEYVREVAKVTDAAASVEAGTFDPETLADVATRDDALGMLARVFQRMAQEVAAREEHLRHQVLQLQIEIDRSEEEKDLNAITHSEYFQQLQRTARDLRDKT